MRQRKKRAQSLVEMAMIAPILLTLLIGVIDLGRAAYDYATLSAAVREGARTATLTGSTRMSNQDVIDAIKRNAVGLSFAGAPCVNGRTSAPVTPVSAASPNTGVIYIISGSASTPTINAPAGQPASGVVGSCAAVTPAMGGRYQLTIKVVYNFQTLTPFIQQFWGSSTVYMVVSSTVTTEY